MTHLTRPQLLALGWTDGRIRAAIRRGSLARIRPGHFTESSLDAATVGAIRVGGRLACLSALHQRGIWVLDDGRIHVHVADNAARLRTNADQPRVHWRPLVEPRMPDSDRVGVVDALIQASGCLSHREWIASVDSAIHLRLLSASGLAAMSRSLPKRLQRVLRLVDGRAESGLESIERVIAVELGFRVRSQVQFTGIGRADLVVEDWIVIETDGTGFHDVSLASRDRSRDARLAARGRTVLRPGYSLVVYDQPAVARQLIGAVASHRKVRDSGRMVARARSRLEKLGLA
jgi:very-short-patch-repair endonuclease